MNEVFWVAFLTVVTSFIGFLITYSVYKRTKGGSRGFLYWAYCAGFYFIGNILILIGILITQNYEFFTRVLGDGFLSILASFFVFFGIIWLGVDFKIFKFKKEFLRKISFLIIILSLFMYLLIVSSPVINILSYEKAMKIGLILSTAMQTIFWFAASISFYPLHKILKKGTIAWSFLYIAVIDNVINNSLQTLINLGIYSETLGIYNVLTAGIFAIFFIFGFFILERALKVF